MTNYVTEQDLLEGVEGKKSITITTQYNRPDPTVPFLNVVTMHKLSHEGRVEIERKKQPYTYRLVFAEGS